MTPVAHSGSEGRRLPRRLVALAAGAGFLLLVTVFAGIGGPHDPLQGLSSVVFLLLTAGWAPLAFVLAGIGLGRVWAPLYRGAGDAATLQIGLGLGLLLTLGQVLGAVGLLAGDTGRVIGGVVCVAGLVMLARQLARLGRDGLDRVSVSGWVLLGLPAAALMLVAACNPPGWLWGSEAGGYDALSYHLQLPQEWLALGRVRPLEHNVYSFLPGYIESGFYAMAAVMGAPGSPSEASRAIGLVAGEGVGVIAAQLLSSGLAVVAAVLVARLAQRVCVMSGVEGERAAGIGALAGVLLLSTPWTVVIGSLAYNDLGVVLFMAAAMSAALERDVPPARRGVMAGLLVGLACCCKPTALFLAGPPVGIVLLAMMPPRRWAVGVGAGVAAGVAAIAPWLIRNWVWSGNPVFPMAASVFGAGHWSAAQVARYERAHFFEGGLGARLALLVMPERAGAPGGGGMRGVLHVQWAAFFVAGAAAAVVAVAAARTRRLGVLLAGGVAVQVVMWLCLTHIQSRFLVPLVVGVCGLLALAAGVVRPRRAGEAGLAVVALVQVIAGVVVFTGERGGAPNRLLTAGPSMRTGEAIRREFSRMEPARKVEVLESVGPEQFLSFWAGPGAPVYLLGEATPLYYRPPVVYNTTWDAWPLAEAMRRAPGDPGAWTRELRGKGIDLVLVNMAEIDRLNRSGEGWADPLITVDTVRGWLKSGPRLIREWPETGSALFELPPEPGR